MFSQQQAVVRVSTSFSSVRLAPPPTHDLQISPAGLSLLLLPKGKPSATLQQCSYGLVLELQLERAAVASIHWAAEKGVFSETGLPVFRILGNSEGTRRAGAVTPRPSFYFFLRCVLATS